jgi:hypothetical protein
MPVDFRLTGVGLDTTFVLWNNLADQYFQIHVAQLPTTGQLDPSNWILKTATLTSAGDDGALAPLSFSLDQNYPNPWNPSTRIRYGLPHNSFVVLTVYNTLGQQVAQLVNEQQEMGYHEAVLRGDGLASGVYYYRLQVGEFVASKKLLLLK